MARIKPKKHDNDGVEENAVIKTLSNGVRVECLPIQGLVDELQSRREAAKPKPPTYTTTDASGQTLKIEYTERTIQGDTTPPEDKAAWMAWLDECERVATEYNERMVKLFAIKGTRVVDMPPDGEWIPEHEWLYGPLPESELERKYHYFKTEVIPSASEEDGFLIILGIAEASGFDKERLEQAEASFRSKMGQKGKQRHDGSRDSGSDEPEPEREGELAQ